MTSEPTRPLTREQCLALLATNRVGRVAVSLGALPAIFPMPYALADDDLVVRAAPGTAFTAALLDSIVCFEIDAVLDDLTAGWSVLVVGRAAEVRAPEELDRFSALPLGPRAPDRRDHFVRIGTERISGLAFGDPP